MKKLIRILPLFLFLAVELATGQQKLAGTNTGPRPSSAPAAEGSPPSSVERVELFKRTLAYMPSILLSTLDRLTLSQNETQILGAILRLSAMNLTISEAEYVRPEKYKIFQVIGSRDSSLFKLKSDETERTAVTGLRDLREPIFINERIVNDPKTRLSLPEVVQLLFHELGRKLMTSQEHEVIREFIRHQVDILGGKIKRVLDQDYMVIALNSAEKLHTLNAPVRLESLPELGMNPEDENYKRNFEIFELYRARFGREILIFHENKTGFTYVPSLKPVLLEDGKNMKPLNKDIRAYSATLTNITEIRVDRSVSARPVVRFVINMKERAYRFSEKTVDQKETGEYNLISLSATNTPDFAATSGDEIHETNSEIAVQFKRNGEVDINRREVLKTDPRLRVENLKWKAEGPEIHGQFQIKVPANLKTLLNPDLRAYLYVRLSDGVSRREVTRLEMKTERMDLEFKLPSEEGAQNSYFVEEILLKNKDTEILLDLPESLRVKAQKRATRSHLQMLKFERSVDGKWQEIKAKENGSSDFKKVSTLNDIEAYKGLVRYPPGEHRFRMLFKSDVPLSELYFYVRSVFVTHDPLVRSTIGSGVLRPVGEGLAQLFGGLINGFSKQKISSEEISKQVRDKLGQNRDLNSLSAAFSQNFDQVITIPASQLKQTRTGSFVWVEFSIPIHFQQDRGPNTYDMGLRYFGEIVAANQNLERWRMEAIGGTLFALEGATFGMQSCSALFKGR